MRHIFKEVEVLSSACSWSVTLGECDVYTADPNPTGNSKCTAYVLGQERRR